MRSIVVLGVYCVLFSLLEAQTSEKILKLEEYQKLVFENHPYSKNANLEIMLAKSEEMIARGNFDPTLEASYETKRYDDKHYYTHLNPHLKVPTLIGADIKAGLDQNNGTRLSESTTDGNVWYLGLEMPLLKGLLMDGRRAALQSAKILVNQSEESRLLMLNDLALEVASDYLIWCSNYMKWKQYSEIATNAQIRLELVRAQYSAGDRAMIDTLEAYSQWLQFEALRAQAAQEVELSRIVASQHFWSSDGLPREIPKNWVPDTLKLMKIDFPLNSDWQVENHPQLNWYNQKIKLQELDLKLKRQNFLPQLNAGAAILSQNAGAMENKGGLGGNFKFGFDFKAPLFLRYARGSVEASKQKLTQTNLQRDYKIWEIKNKVKNAQTELEMYIEQIDLMQRLADAYQKLLRNEEFMLRQGESTIFLINSRENKWIESNLKLISLYEKAQKTYRKKLWAMGQR